MLELSTRQISYLRAGFDDETWTVDDVPEDKMENLRLEECVKDWKATQAQAAKKSCRFMRQH